MGISIADGSFSSKVALVTGATSGIGRAAAVLYARKGAKVVVAGRRTVEGEETVRQIREAGGEAIFVPANVAVAADVQRLIERTLSTYGRLDVAFNNAGTLGKLGPITELDEKVWGDTIDVNLKGAWLSLKYEIPALQQSGGGAIVFNTSVAADAGFSGFGAYAASKGGVVSLARAAAVEVAPQKIRVNVVSPGPIATDMAVEAFGNLDEFTAYMAQRIPVGRIGIPEEIAEAAVWLTSDAAAFITGQVLTVDGGFTAQ